LNPRLRSLMVRKWSTVPISLSYTTPLVGYPAGCLHTPASPVNGAGAVNGGVRLTFTL
jgi:hypothetical protein